MTGGSTPGLDHRLVDLLIEFPDACTGDLLDTVRREHPAVPVAELSDAVERAVARANGYGSLDQLLATDDITEIMMNGPGPIWIERNGALERTDLRVGRSELDLLVSRLLDPLGLRVDRLHPMADGRLPDGSRVNVIVPPLALDGPTITIRRFPTRAIGLDAFGPPEINELLRTAVQDRRTIVVSGGTGAGKTTLLNALIRFIPDHQRIVTIEDTAELDLGSRHVVRLEARSANAEGMGAVTIRDLVKNALRMRPDRIVLGETRSAECLDLLMALTTGHRGSFTTVHANHAAGALRRLQLLASLADATIAPTAITEILAETVDYVVHIERFGPKRGIAAVAQMIPNRPLDPVVIWSAES